MNQNPIIKALQDELARKCDKAFRDPELAAQISCSSHYFAFVSGNEAATAFWLPLIERAVEVIEDVAKMHPDANPIFRIEKAREFLKEAKCVLY